MNIRTLFLCVFAALTVSIHAADWEAMKRNPASIEVVGMQSVPLAVSSEKQGWAKIPDQLTRYKAVIYKPTGQGPTDSINGVTNLTVLADGWLIIACNFDYQGNPGGDWDEEAWTEKRFKAKGWSKLNKGELGGDLVKGDKREQALFAKQVRRGEKLKLRCNKYDPPYPILLSPK